MLSGKTNLQYPFPSSHHLHTSLKKELLSVSRNLSSSAATQGLCFGPQLKGISFDDHHPFPGYVTEAPKPKLSTLSDMSTTVSTWSGQGNQVWGGLWGFLCFGFWVTNNEQEGEPLSSIWPPLKLGPIQMESSEIPTKIIGAWIKELLRWWIRRRNPPTQTTLVYQNIQNEVWRSHVYYRIQWPQCKIGAIMEEFFRP